jgi:integrase/recombinase XerD
MIDKYIRHLQKNNYSKNTITTYKNVIKFYADDLHDIRNIKNRIKSHIKNPNTA